jgi:hypothetical protein
MWIKGRKGKAKPKKKHHARCYDDVSMQCHVHARCKGAAAVGSSSGAMPMLMVCCNTMAWTDETEGPVQKLLVTSSDPVAGMAVTTEEQAKQQMTLKGAPAERSCTELK